MFAHSWIYTKEAQFKETDQLPHALFVLDLVTAVVKSISENQKINSNNKKNNPKLDCKL